MATLSQPTNENKQSGSVYQPCFDVTKLVAFKPSTKAISEFRPIPEVARNGELLPMVLGQTPAGPDYSAVTRETVVVGAGITNKFTGLCRSSDMEETDEPRMIFPGLFIRLRSMEKKGTLPEHIRARAQELLAQRPSPGNSEIKTQYLPRAQNLVFMQGISIVENGVKLDKPAGRKALVLSATAGESLNELLKDCFAKKIDVFSATDGYSIVVEGLPPDRKVGRQVPMFLCKLGRKMPISEEQAKKLWTPWSSALVVRTQADMLKRAIAIYGQDIVEVVFPDEVAALRASAPPVTVQAPPPPAAPAKPATVTAPVDTLQVDDGPPVLGAGDEEDAPSAPSTQPAPAAVAPASGADTAAEFDRLLADLR